MRHSLLVWGLVLLMACAHAQSVAWSRLYLHANSRGFLPQVAAADPQGNLIVAGRYIHQDTAFNSVAIVKYAPNGDLLWTRTFGELTEAEYAEAIAVAPDGSFYLGITRANWDSLAFLQRWSANGELLWSVQINLSAYDVIRQILVRPDGGAEVLHSFGSGGIGFARLRYDASGNLLLNNQYSAPFTLLRNRTPVGILLLNANTTLIAYIDGEINEVLRGYSRTYLRAINNTGGTVYEALFPLRTERWARADDGSLYLLGDYWDRASQQMRLRLCRVNPANGALLGQWDLTAVAGDAIPDILAASGGVWLATGAWETASTRGITTLLGTASGASLRTATLEGVYRPIAGVRTATGALAQLIGELFPNPDRWKPALQWFRNDGALMAQGYLPPLSAADESPELLVASPDGALYVVATIQQGSENIAGAGDLAHQPAAYPQRASRAERLPARPCRQNGAVHAEQRLANRHCHRSAGERRELCAANGRDGNRAGARLCAWLVRAAPDAYGRQQRRRHGELEPHQRRREPRQPDRRRRPTAGAICLRADRREPARRLQRRWCGGRR
jgi:hypothetical protein